MNEIAMRDITYRQAMLGISVVSFVTLAFEIVVNKALGFSVWGQLGFMIIGSAIFGFSIAGVVIALWKPHQKYLLSHLLGYASLIFSVSVVICYVVMNVVPFGFGRMYYEPVSQVLFLQSGI